MIFNFVGNFHDFGRFGGRNETDPDPKHCLEHEITISNIICMFFSIVNLYTTLMTYAGFI